MKGDDGLGLRKCSGTQGNGEGVRLSVVAVTVCAGQDAWPLSLSTCRFRTAAWATAWAALLVPDGDELGTHAEEQRPVRHRRCGHAGFPEAVGCHRTEAGAHRDHRHFAGLGREGHGASARHG
jgi:hypothetical protein